MSKVFKISKYGIEVTIGNDYAVIKLYHHICLIKFNIIGIIWRYIFLMNKTITFIRFNLTLYNII